MLFACHENAVLLCDCDEHELLSVVVVADVVVRGRLRAAWPIDGSWSEFTIFSRLRHFRLHVESDSGYGYGVPGGVGVTKVVSKLEKR
jgi:hypothetical protein